MDTIIVDNWYENPDEIRKMAISNFQEKMHDSDILIWDEKNQNVGGYPGHRTHSNFDNLFENFAKFEKVLGKKLDKKTWIYKDAVNFDYATSVEKCAFNYSDFKLYLKGTEFVINDRWVSNGEVQCVFEHHKRWVHHDNPNTLAAVVYLTPDPPPHSGTAMYKHKKTNYDRINANYKNLRESMEEYLSPSTWSIVEENENVYNRCVIWDAQKFHSAVGAFGDSIENCRLTQVFFFDLE